MTHFVSSDWAGIWPPMRLEAHYGDRVIACFAERPASLHRMLEQAVQRNPDGVALVCGDERLSYRELLDRSSRLAAGFAACGVGPGDRVALLLGNRIEFVLALFAAARLGAVAVPLSVREQTPGLAYMLGHCAAVMLLHEAELAPLLPAEADLPALRSRILRRRQRGIAAVRATARHGAGPEPARVAEEDTAAILYTSGTTGRPKGAMLTHLGIVHSSMHYQIAMELGAGDSAIAAVPLSHVTGLVALITTMVRAAGKLTIMPAFKAADFLRLAARERMTHTLMVPAMYNLCLLQSDFASHDLTHWRIGAFGGAPMPLATIEALARTVPSLTLMNCYGATETTSPTTLMPAGCNAAHADTVGTHAGLRRGVRDGRRRPRSAAWPDRRDLDRRPDGRAGLLAQPRGDGREPQRGLLAFGRHRLGGRRRLCPRRRPQEGHDQPRRLQDLLDRGRERAVRASRGARMRGRRQALPGAGRAGACLRRPEGRRHHGRRVDRLRAPRLSDYKVPESFTISTAPLPRNANGKLLKRAMRDELLASLNGTR